MFIFPVYLSIASVFLLVGLVADQAHRGGRRRSPGPTGVVHRVMLWIDYAIVIVCQILVVVAYALQVDFLQLLHWPETTAAWLAAALLFAACFLGKQYVLKALARTSLRTCSGGLASPGGTALPLCDVLFFFPLAVLGIPTVVYVLGKAITLLLPVVISSPAVEVARETVASGRQRYA
ncbi:hypothetical protein QWY85_12640 [Neolewinella lacunae]|uniref:Uncharacterized protein n=1 Tax=Neolewinella lacunae TaxID=1517758 RepID=A0A923TCQ0_9BACT|nr:hypothetical protein [Neolewinella lacunae]MBC6993972.1 hypothetical protein [Neolewinella lacunae]MDN3635513.1 hypothetical protein [Neolewinella lacunae]